METANVATETIVAVATAAGSAGIGVVRVSGSKAAAIASALTGLAALRSRYAHFVKLHDANQQIIDEGLALFFLGPNSFTGEDVLEIQAHGSPIVLQTIVETCVQLGARLARAGEFSERAFLNDKIDLVQAEAIADLIAAQSKLQAQAAQRSLQGEFSERVNVILAAMIHLRLHVEAAIDFPEEEIDFLADGKIFDQLKNLQTQVANLLIESERGQRLRDGLHVVIAGKPNAGKSSLLNALAGKERAIVTAIPGTTRDLLHEYLIVDGVAITLIDTAGLRETSDEVEIEGVRRARDEMQRADLILLVVDDSESDPAEELLRDCPAHIHRLWLHNKIDKTGVPSKRQQDQLNTHIWLSAKTQQGLDLLREEIRQRGGGDAGTGTFSTRARHVNALKNVSTRLETAEQKLLHDRAGELVAEELRLAQQQLSEITGQFSSDDLLGAIFSSFCIGK